MFLFSSCSATYHIKKAVKKDPTIIQEGVVTDTLTIEKLDSVAYTINDTIRYTYFKTTTDTLIEFKYKYIQNPKTRQEIRLESKEVIKVIKEDAKTDRLDLRLDKRLNQTEVRKSVGGWRLWIFLLIIGFILGMVFILIIKK
jgi:hypothetical protein